VDAVVPEPARARRSSGVFFFPRSRVALRGQVLPEDYYCPNVPWAADAAWRTSWRTNRQTGVYKCRAVHGRRDWPATVGRLRTCLGLANETAFRATCGGARGAPPATAAPTARARAALAAAPAAAPVGSVGGAFGAGAVAGAVAALRWRGRPR